MTDNQTTDEYVFVEKNIFPPQPWLHLLTPMQRAWREDQILKGQNPDSYIEQELKNDGSWPE